MGLLDWAIVWSFNKNEKEQSHQSSFYLLKIAFWYKKRWKIVQCKEGVERDLAKLNVKMLDSTSQGCIMKF